MNEGYLVWVPTMLQVLMILCYDLMTLAFAPLSFHVLICRSPERESKSLIYWMRCMGEPTFDIHVLSFWLSVQSLLGMLQREPYAAATPS